MADLEEKDTELLYQFSFIYEKRNNKSRSARGVQGLKESMHINMAESGNCTRITHYSNHHCFHRGALGGGRG